MLVFTFAMISYTHVIKTSISYIVQVRMKNFMYILYMLHDYRLKSIYDISMIRLHANMRLTYLLILVCIHLFLQQLPPKWPPIYISITYNIKGGPGSQCHIGPVLHILRELHEFSLRGTGFQIASALNY